MIKRARWFVSGAVAGAAGVSYASRKVKRTAAQLAPVEVARTVGRRVRDRAHDIGEAVRDGRAAMRAKEAELRALRDGRAADVHETLATGSEVLVDGRPAAPGQVIVLHPERSDTTAQNHPAVRHARRQHRRRSR